MKIYKQQEIVEEAKLGKVAGAKQGIRKCILKSACTLESLGALKIYQSLCLPRPIESEFLVVRSGHFLEFLKILHF